MRKFPFGLSYLMWPGRSESPGVTPDFCVAARRSASQPTKARARSTTTKISRKVPMTMLTPLSGVRTDLDPSGRRAALLHHDAWNAGGRQFLPRAYAIACQCATRDLDAHTDHAASLSAPEISLSVAFSASLTATPPMPRNPPSLSASATCWLI